MLTGGFGGDEVEGACLETIVSAGKSTNGADLYSIAGEVGSSIRFRYGGDLLTCATFGKGDAPISGNLLGETSAPCTENAAFPVKKDIADKRQRRGEVAFLAIEARLTLPIGHGLVL